MPWYIHAPTSTMDFTLFFPTQLKPDNLIHTIRAPYFLHHLRSWVNVTWLLVSETAYYTCVPFWRTPPPPLSSRDSNTEICSAPVRAALEMRDWILPLLYLRDGLLPKMLLFLEIKLFCVTEGNNCYVTLMFKSPNKISEWEE